MSVFSSKFSRSFLDCPQIPFEMSRGMHNYTGKPKYCQYCHSCQSGDKCGANRQNGERKINFESSLSPGTGDRKINYAGEHSHLVANPKSLMNALAGPLTTVHLCMHLCNICDMRHATCDICAGTFVYVNCLHLEIFKLKRNFKLKKLSS
jgi:hypothetical protein